MRDTTSIGKILESSGIVHTEEEKAAQLIKTTELIKSLRFHMYKSSPAFAIILGQLKLVFTYEIPTFAVDNKNNIYINPMFSATMTPAENLGVLVHEVMHIATLTFHRQRGRDMKLWNMCTDYLMNYDIIKAGFSLPSQGLIPKPNGDCFFKDHTGKVHCLNIDNKTAEWLYAEYLKLPQPPPDGGSGGEDNGDPSDPSDPGDPGDPGEGNGQPSKGSKGSRLEPCDEKGSTRTSIDDHLTDGDTDGIIGEDGGDQPNQKAPTMAEIKNMMNQAKNTVDQMRNSERSDSRSPGGDNTDIASVMFKHITSKTDYKLILRDLFKRTSQFYDWRKPSRRSLAVGSFLPKSTKKTKSGSVGIAIDTSGSVSSEDINVIMNEVAKLLKQFPNIEVEVVLWASTAYYHNKFTKANTSAIIADVSRNVRSGGTELSSVAMLYDANKLTTPDAMIYFTDGHVESKPYVLSKARNIFMIFSWGSDTTLLDAKIGKVYNINL